MKKFIYQLATDQKKGFIASVLKIILLFLSAFYCAGVWVRNFLYDFNILKTERLIRPVICVGNLTVGGAGKTPFVIYLAEYFKSLGVVPVILMRGYQPDKASNPYDSDEYKLLKLRLEGVDVLLGENRYEVACKHLKHNKVDVFIMDDGFQHRKLHRDLNIALINTQNPWGNKWLLPRGILREGIEELTRAQMLVLTKAEENLSAVLNIQRTIAEKHLSSPTIITQQKCTGLINLISEEEEELSLVEGKMVCLVSSIGDPNTFEKTARSLKMDVGCRMDYMDHHQYQKSDILDICEKMKELNIKYLITTQKDAVKLISFKDLFDKNFTLLIIKIDLDIVEGEGVLGERICRLLIS